MGKFAHRKINYDNARNIARNMANATVKPPMSREDFDEKQGRLIRLIEERCCYSNFREGKQIFSNLVEPMQAWDELGHETQLAWEKSLRDYSYRNPFKRSLYIGDESFGFNEPIKIADDREVNITFECEIGKYGTLFSHDTGGIDWCFIGGRATEEFENGHLQMFVDKERLARHKVKPFDIKKDYPLLHKQIVDLLLPMAIWKSDFCKLQSEIVDQIVDRTTKQVMDTWEESKGFIYENYGYTDDDSSSMIAPYSELVSKCGINLLTAQ